MKYLALLAIFAAFFCCSAFADCSVNIKQTLGSAWQQEGKNLSQWNVAITAGSEAVKSLELTITGATINQLWELTNKSNNVFALPDWRLQNGGIPAGQTHQFGYIWQSPSQATITVSSIDCGALASPSPSASPAAPSPSPSASPAAPSASPSAAPSTIVSTPQPSPAGSCSVNIKQTLGSAWQQDGKNLSQWNAVITAGSQAVKSLELTITGARLIQVWELNNKSNGVFALPDYRLQNGGLAAGQTHQFGYIWESASQATITVSSINCGAAAPSPSASPAAPSASASPAAPSASPSAAPSTIVSTPQPSSAPASCSLNVDQAARSTQDGSWTTGDFKFQIYDLTFTNNGNQAVNGAQINVALNANQEIYQFWNIERQSANSNGFNVPMSWGPLQVGATLGAGYIVRSPVSAGNIAAPAVTITSTTCSGSTTAAPSPSASPAAPSASPSANPTIVATPQPSSANGCSATVSVVARSAASGGVWQNGGATFQIFDISLQNNGQRAVNGGVFTFGFAESGASIFQFWELNRQGSSNAFNVAFNYGPLQAGASQGSGIIVQLAGSSPAAVPSVTLSSLACQ